jgi:hypothetical protein
MSKPPNIIWQQLVSKHGEGLAWMTLDEDVQFRIGVLERSALIDQPERMQNRDALIFPGPLVVNEYECP